VNETGKEALAGAGVTSFLAVDAGGQPVYVVKPSAQIEAEPIGEVRWEDTGYSRLQQADRVRVALDRLAAPVAAVANTRLFAFSAEASAGLLEAGVRADALHTAETPYPSALPAQPYRLVRWQPVTKGARFKEVSLTTIAEGAIPEENPLSSVIRDEEGALLDGPDPYWKNHHSPQDLLLKAYTSGGALPAVTLTQAKPKASNRLADLLATNYLLVSARARALFDELGVEAEYRPLVLHAVDGKPLPKATHLICRPVAREWLDWEASDVNWTGSNTIWGFREMELRCAELARSAELLVRIGGTRLHLAHQRLIAAIEEAGLRGFSFEDPAWYAHAYNLDDELTDWSL